jgi:oligoendopeptidase F
LTWARIPHFFSTPYYVYQYATCFASSAQLKRQITTGRDEDRAAAVERYLSLLKSGGSDHPMTLLKRAGVDLSQPETVKAMIDHLETLVTQLEKTLA